MGNNKIDSIQKDVKHYFGFLFERGYEIRDSVYDSQNFGNWRVLLESPNCIIEISNDRNELFVSFASFSDRKSLIGLKPMIYFLSQGKNFIGSYEGNLFWGKKKQFEILTNLLKEYIDQITPYFGKDFKNYRNDLMLAGKKYVDILIERYTQKMMGKP